MTREECVKALQKSAKGEGFITRAELQRFVGVSKWKYAEKFAEGCTLIDDQYYFIREVAGRIMMLREQGGQA